MQESARILTKFNFMINIRYYLDTRWKKTELTKFPLKISLSRMKQKTMFPTGISLESEFWDNQKQELSKSHPQYRNLKLMLDDLEIKVRKIIDRLEESGQLVGIGIIGVKDLVLSELHPKIDKKADQTVKEPQKPVFSEQMDNFMSRKHGRTYEIYNETKKKLKAFKPDEYDSLTFEEMDVNFIRDFDEFLSKTSTSRNARNIHLRNIRAIFNDAINEDLITVYPFRKFKIRPEPTKKRALPVERIREIFNGEYEEWEQRHIDCFKLIFLLCGINIADLFNLEKIEDGRIEYNRAKTHRHYSIKVEPEAMHLIEKWKGKKKLLCYGDTIKDYRTYYSRLMGCLKKYNLCTYNARHSWATIAASLDIPKETIAAALGHGGNTVTDIYIDFDQRKVDEANRKVLDWVLYGKR